VRLYDTYTRGLRDLPPPPGPIRIYSCGPTVYRRIHVGNAVPFIVAMWLRRWLLETGYEAKLVINITDINDKIYDAAPGESARQASMARTLRAAGVASPPSRARSSKRPSRHKRRAFGVSWSMLLVPAA
jgi:cysteinyl-tRNA synthetase